MQTVLARALALAIVIVPAFAGTAQAAGTGDPQILAPSDGAHLEAGWSGPLRIDFGDAPEGGYDIGIQCSDSGYSWSTSYNNAEGDGQFAEDVPAIGETTEQSCSVQVTDSATGGANTDVNSGFTVAAKPTALDYMSVTPATFYPRVRDGYRDTVDVEFGLPGTMEDGADATAKITNSRGYTVRSVALGNVWDYDYWSWGGRNKYGDFVRVGTYKIAITAVDDDGNTASSSKKVRVASEWRNRKVTKRKTGYQTSSTRRTKSCYTDHFYYEDTVQLDCWGGKHAIATYYFHIPRNARHLHWHVSGHQGCCSQGHIIKTGKRVSHKTYRVRVKVTNWRSFTITGVKVSYNTRQRV